MSETIEFRVQRDGVRDGSAAIALAGEVDLFAASELEAAVRDAVEAGATRLVIDLSEVSFIDSTTIGILVAARKRVHPLGGTVAVICSDRSVLRLFEVTALDRLFEIRPHAGDGPAGANGRTSANGRPAT